MIDLQKMLVDEHIAGIQHDAATLRAERERDRTRAVVPGHAGSDGVRVRIGHWLVAVGEALAGPPAPCDDDAAVAA